MIDDQDTERIVEPPAPARGPRSVLTGLTAVLACALALLAGGVIVAQIVAAGNGQPGPGALAVVAHLLGAAAGIAGYRLASRRTGAVPRWACGALLAVAALLLWFFWWAA